MTRVSSDGALRASAARSSRDRSSEGQEGALRVRESYEQVGCACAGEGQRRPGGWRVCVCGGRWACGEAVRLTLLGGWLAWSEQHIKELRAEHAADLRARDAQTEKLRARLERALADVEEWRRVGSEGEVHRRRACEVSPLRPALGPPTLHVCLPSRRAHAPR
jgi:hypothetical protein